MENPGLSVLLDRETMDAETLAGAIAATFIRRGMAVPASLPVGLTDEFSGDVTRQALWHAFLKKNELDQQPLPEVVAALRARLEPALLIATTLANQSPNWFLKNRQRIWRAKGWELQKG